MASFNEMVYLWIGKKKYVPAEYDQRFNFPLLGKREGLVFFPRYDEKTGESFFKKDVTLRFVMSGAASPVSDGKDIRFTWDVKGREDDASMSGTAADRIEVDRLLRRVEKLAKEKSDLESQHHRKCLANRKNFLNHAGTEGTRWRRSNSGQPCRAKI